jgi:hypothetical protein
MAKLTPDRLSMFHLMTFADSHKPISSQELQDGHMPLDLQDGQMTEKSGREAARVNRLALQEKVKELTMSGIYGRTFFDSLEAVAPQSSWVSKLQARLGMVGSTESDLIWKVKATPAMASIFRLAPQTRRTSGQDCIGWRTPNTRDGMQSGYADMEKLANRWERGKQVQLCDQVRMKHKTWVSPTAQDGTRGNQPPREWDTGVPLSQEVVIAESATWPTPRVGDTPDKTSKPGYFQGLSNVARDTGATQSGSTEPTEKRGALNPTFVCWLMGFPPEWESCAPTVMPSSRRSRQK